MSEPQSIAEVTEIASAYYSQIGFQSRIGYGKRPALINIDLANAWTQPGNPFTCHGMDVVIPAVQTLLRLAREKNLPVVFTATAYSTDWDSGVWAMKIPSLKILKVGSPLCDIDERVKPSPNEFVIHKKAASAFNGTNLASVLQGRGIDTVIITGVTACCCVRATAEDAVSLGFRPIVVRETVSDRVPGVVQWNLFDIDAKFGDVEPLEKVVAYLSNLTPLSF